MYIILFVHCIPLQTVLDAYPTTAAVEEEGGGGLGLSAEVKAYLEQFTASVEGETLVVGSLPLDQLKVTTLHMQHHTLTPSTCIIPILTLSPCTITPSHLHFYALPIYPHHPSVITPSHYSHSYTNDWCVIRCSLI